jgi:hypothetical protein
LSFGNLTRLFSKSCNAPFERLAPESVERGGKFFDGFEEDVGFGGAESLFGGKRAEDGDSGAYAGATRHLQVFRRVTDIDTFCWTQRHVAKCEAKRRGMGFAQSCIAATDAGSELVPQAELAQLAVHAITVATGNETKSMVAGKQRKNPARTRKEFGTMAAVAESPGFVGGVPFGARKLCGAIDVVPVGRIVPFEFGDAPGNLHFAKHGQVGGGIGSVGVKKSAVPVEQDALEW